MRRRVLLAIIALQVAVPSVALLLRVLQDGQAVRFGWHMFAGMP